MEEAKKAAAKRHEEALERLAKEEAEELRRYEDDLAKATKASLSTADAGPDAMDPGARASTDPAPATPAPHQTANGRRYPAQRLSSRPGAGRLLRSGSRANAPRAPLTRQAIQTPRYPGAFANSSSATGGAAGGWGAAPVR